MATTITGRIPFRNPDQACLPIFGQRSCCETNENTDVSQTHSSHRTQIPLHSGVSGRREDTTSKDYREGQSIRHPDENPSDELRQRMDDEARTRIESMTEKDWDEVFKQWTEKDIFIEWEKELE